MSKKRENVKKESKERKKISLKWQSMRARSIRSLVLIATFAILVIGITGYLISRNSLNKEISQKMSLQLASATADITKNLEDHLATVKYLAGFYEKLGTNISKQKYLKVQENIFKHSADTLGLGIWFEPYKYNSQQKNATTYIYKDGDKFVFDPSYESDSYNYFAQDWYTIPLKTEKVFCTTPFVDAVQKILMTTFSFPVYDQQNKLVGVATGDINLKNLQEMVLKSKIGETGEAYLIDQEGSFVVHKDTSLIMNQKITEFENKEIAAFGKKLLSDDGDWFSSFHRDGKKYYAYYKKVELAQWYFVSIITKDELYASLNKMLIAYFLLAFLVLTIATLIALFTANRQAKPVVQLAADFDLMSTGELAQSDERGTEIQKKVNENDEYEINQLSYKFSVLARRLKEIIESVVGNSQSLASTAIEMSATVDTFAQNSQTQAASAEELTASVEEVSASMDGILGNTNLQSTKMGELIEVVNNLALTIVDMRKAIEQAENNTQQISSNAQDGEKSMRLMNESMLKISESSGDMTGIVDVITNISEQINLLSLNASIEAARAGEAGKGFAVVADEISKLADQTSSSIQEINNLIKSNDEEIKIGMDNVMDSIEKMSTIIEGVGSVKEITNDIVDIMSRQLEAKDQSENKITELKEKTDQNQTSIEEQKHAVDEIVKAITNINEATQANAAGAEQMSSTSENVAALAENLKDQVEFFKV